MRRRHTRGVLFSLLLLILVVAGVGYFVAMRPSRSQTAAPAAVGTSGTVNTAQPMERNRPVDIQRARERGARLGEDMAVAANRVAEATENAATTTKIKAKMTLDDLVKARRIDVSTDRGTVTLDGTVGSPAEHDRAVALARQTEGVSVVVDHLTIQGQ